MIKLSERQFKVLPEGEIILQVKAVDYKQKLGHMTVTLVNNKGLVHNETFRFINKDGNINQGGINVFSFFARTAMNDTTLEEIDEKDLVGRFIKCTVEHNVQANINDPNKTVTFVRLNNFEPALGFEENDPLADL